MVACLFVFLFCLLGDAPPAGNPPPPHLSVAVAPNQVHRWRWTQEHWTTDGDARFHTERCTLDAVFADGQGHDDVVSGFKAASQESPNDRFKLFQWAYATYGSERNVVHMGRDLQLGIALSNAKPPFSYEYLRMCFLYYSAEGRQNDYLTSLGERLAKADPRDLDVLNYVSRSMSNDIPDARKKALQYARRLMEIAPNDPRGYTAFANVYWFDWMDSRATDADAAREVIRGLNEYLKRETRPSQEEKRKTAQRIIDRMNETIAEAQKKPRHPAKSLNSSGG